MRLAHNIGLLCSLWALRAAAYTAVPRWGQAVAVVNDALFVYGGKTDQYNEFQYLSAPWNNDLLYLSLSSPFDPTVPPWQYVSGSQNASSQSQGVSLAWHTLSVFNSSYALGFGGNTGPNSDMVLMDQNDSAFFLNFYNRLEPTFVTEANLWAGEPQRRMRHSAASANGLIWIFGGERADGSSNGFSDHYVFDPSAPSFTVLPTNNAPPDIYGHASIVLIDGNILVFGGYCQSQGQLIPFSTIWSFNTTSLEWSLVPIDTSSLLPDPRMAFAAVLLTDGRILIQGGTDSTFDVNFSDGWILDTSRNPMTWTGVTALSQLGARRDHFAVSVGDQVVFGFGYGTNGPADAQLHVYDVGSGTFSSSYSPMTAPPAHQTIPPNPTQTNSGSGHTATWTGTEQNSGGTGGHSATQTGPVGFPTSSAGSGSGSGSGGNGGNGTGQDGGTNPHKTTAIAIGSVIGILALVGGTGLAAYYLQRRHTHATAFSPLGGDDEESHQITALPISSEKGPSLLAGPFSVLGAVGIGRARRVPKQRRDILADEDRSFEWTDVRREGSGGSSSFGSRGGSGRSSRARTLADVVTGSWASLKALGGRTRSTRSREATQTSVDWEKLGGDPFSDEVALMAEGLAGDGLPERPRGGDASSSQHPYSDPFANQSIDVLHDYGSDDDEFHPTSASGLNARPPPNAIRTALPPTGDFVPMSPLIEQASRNSLSTSSLSHGAPSNPLESSNSSLGTPKSPRPSSIIDANPPPNLPMRRSDSWWARFAKTPLLDRSGSSKSLSGFIDFRDPNPPPRLHPIEESMHSQSPDSPEHKGKSRAGSGDSQAVARRGSIYQALTHGKSASSLQTANTETLERAAGTMDIIQRDGTMDSQYTAGNPALGDDFGVGHIAVPSTSSLGSVPSRPRPLLIRGEPSQTSQLSESTIESQLSLSPLGTPTHELPTEETSHAPSAFMFDMPPRIQSPVGPRSPGGTPVASRIREYERRLSRDGETLPPTNTRRREERTTPRPAVRYGLVPRQSMFVANPDRRQDSRASDGTP
ncbi:hypothetical protein BV25DRAFT_1834986 [Artomyces pyxidatus]|uniref:Uncharacterized protein n=1 Tax=Artomyces pyxidatus TaxID=48021 RepID=A0ACB8TFV3_9AGAM|nr:hypothetical protein BV25DRAFT_1834986 [Artomyces pyxidatus]